MNSLKTSVVRQKPEDKAAHTTQVARAIADKERRESEQKTERLRALRMARDAAAPIIAPTVKKLKAKAKA